MQKSFTERVKSWIGIKANTGKVPTNEFYQQLYSLLGGQVQTLPQNMDSYINKGYVLNPHVYTVINRIIKPASAVPHYVYRIKQDRRKEFERYKFAMKNGDIEQAEFYSKKAIEIDTKSKDLNKLLTNPNPEQSFQEFQEQGLGFELLTGNGFVFMQEAVGFEGVTELYNMPSQLVEIVTGDWTQPVKGYRIFYFGVTDQVIDKDKVCHIKYFNPQYNHNSFQIDIKDQFITMASDTYGLYGMSPMAPLCKVVKKSNDAITALMSILQHGHPIGILSDRSERGMTKEQAEALEKRFQDHFGGAERKGKPFLTSADIQWQQLGFNSVDMQLLDADKYDLETIARVYGVPLPTLLSDASTFNNYREAEKSIYTKAIIPALARRRDALNRSLLPKFADSKNLYIDFDLSMIQELKQDEKDQVEIIKKEIESGTLTPNEGRERRGRQASTDEAMNAYYIANNIRPIKEPINNSINNG